MQTELIFADNVRAMRRKRPTRSGVTAFAAALSAGMMGTTARAATPYIYTPDNTAGSTWSSGAQSSTQWSSGGVAAAPVSATTSVLTFGQSSAGVTTALDGITNVNTFNIASSTFTLTTLNLEGSVASGNTGSVSLNGTGTSGIGGSTLTLSTGIVNLDANGSGLTYNIDANVNDGNNTSYNGSGTATFAINGAVSGASNLIKNATGLLVLAGNNTFGNSTHGLEVFGGTV